MNRREALVALMSLPATASVSVAQVKPKDVIVVEYPGHISHEGALMVKAHLQPIWPDNTILVLGEGTMKVVKSDA